MKQKCLARRGIALFALAWALPFFVILFCNILTDYCVDDFTYLFSLATKERITSFFQIFPSLAAHAEKMNGRLIAHFLTHLFLLLPKSIFDIANTAVFLLQIALITRIGSREKASSPWLPVFAFFSLWLFEPAFGQVNFWLDGACNYLWSSAVALLFLYPFAMRYLRGRVIEKASAHILFVIFGFFAGNFMENSSATAIILAALFMLISFLCEQKRPRAEEIGAVISAFIGFLCMILSPAEMENKIGMADFSVFYERLTALVEKLADIAILLLFVALLLLLACYQKADKKTCIFAILIIVGGLFSHFLLIFAPYYPDRCGAFTVVLLTCAAVTLMEDLLRMKARLLILGAIFLTLCFGSYHLALGVRDVYLTNRAMQENIQIIKDAAEEGNSDVSLPIVTPTTRYSAIHGLRYLADDPNDWPNRDMARYYGISSITGYVNEPQ